MKKDLLNSQLVRLFYTLNLISHVAFFLLEAWFIVNVFRSHADLMLCLILSMSIQLWSVLHLLLDSLKIYRKLETLATLLSSVYIVYLLWLYDYPELLQITQTVYTVVTSVLDVCVLSMDYPMTEQVDSDLEDKSPLIHINTLNDWRLHSDNYILT